MGWDGPEGRPDERPAHQVRLDGFWIDATEVTNAQFAAFASRKFPLASLRMVALGLLPCWLHYNA